MVQRQSVYLLSIGNWSIYNKIYFGKEEQATNQFLTKDIPKHEIQNEADLMENMKKLFLLKILVENEAQYNKYYRASVKEQSRL